ncbi:MAG TPA: hypothetical protein PKH69_00410 [Thiobacillaceae bacterium]|nr:hypothetical protein [Thiobacillaceae bacterium]HNU63424.1 hypothetical protein [Thiobacillaceae bacterium]
MSHEHEWVCWRCGADISRLPRPLGRRAQCPGCHAELHVCRLCRHHDPGKAKQCREPMAEEVQDKTRANFCEWFQAQARQTTTFARENSQDAAQRLFGTADGKSPPGDGKSALDRLFGD